MIKATNISDAWFQTCREAFLFGLRTPITRGSFAGQERRQLPWLQLIVREPAMRPLACELNGVAYSTDNDVQRYFYDYLMSEKRNPGEHYTYGQRITPYIGWVIDVLSADPDTNQVCLSVSRPEDVWLSDPPCLRSLAWKVVNGRLNLCSYWRSWDLHSGLPTNLGGLQLLNEAISEATGIRSGALIAFSDGAHIYDHVWKIWEEVCETE